MKHSATALLLASILFSSCSSQTEELIDYKINEGYIETMEDVTKINGVSDAYVKKLENGNPISSEFYCADPTAVEYNGRLYVYGTNDHQQYEAVGDEGSNTYDKIKSFQVFSTDDMVNWTHHGTIDVESVAPWIMNSWAPSVVSRVEEDGLTHFYLYFSNNGCGVGVITATDPLGPWSDPLGKPLVNYDTEGLDGCPNPFDPGVCIDDNGDGWIAFGGGRKKGGTDFMPGVARIAKLGKDMVSFDSEFVEIKAPYFFEASELNFINGTYVYTYNNSWEKRIEWGIEGASLPKACSMSYMTSKTPLDTDSWVYVDDYFCNPGESGLGYSNNHSHLHKYMGKYYMFHHTMLRQTGAGTTTGGFRSLCVVEIPVNEETLEITPTGGNFTGVPQIKNVDPYAENMGETFYTTTGVDFEYDGTGITAVKSTEKGTVICVKGVDFGEEGAGAFTAKVKGKGRIEIRLGNPESECVAAVEADSTEYQGYLDRAEEKITGVHDIYIVFSHKDMSLDSWQFI